MGSAGTGRVGSGTRTAVCSRGAMLCVGANYLDALAPILGVREDDVVDHAPAIPHRFLEQTSDVEPVSIRRFLDRVCDVDRVAQLGILTQILAPSGERVAIDDESPSVKIYEDLGQEREAKSSGDLGQHRMLVLRVQYLPTNVRMSAALDTPEPVAAGVSLASPDRVSAKAASSDVGMLGL